jgi:DNA-binding NarL/FixJ family response regulator
MQFIEILLMAAGVILLLAAVYLGRNDTRPTPAVPPAELSSENTNKLHATLTQLLQEMERLSRDMTIDVEQTVSELKKMLQTADRKIEALSLAGEPKRPTEEPTPGPQPGTEETAESPDPELDVTIEDDAAPSIASERHREIIELADQGLSVEDIARRMQTGKGEIQLILTLRKRD